MTIALRTTRTRAVALAVAMLLALSACSGGTDESSPTTDASDAGSVAESTDDTTTGGAGELPPCDAEFLGSDDTTEFTSARYVVDGTAGEVCLGDDDAVLDEAWAQLAAIAPVDQLAHLSLFGAFVTSGEGDEETLAFVNVIDEQGEEFQMSVNTEAYSADANEATLTMAHEFSHVFTQVPGQLDRTVTDPADCPTYFNGEGCYTEDSLMARWVSEFWDPSELATIDPFEEPGVDDGAERCAADAGFFGSYAATNPEEDFAEAFSAFVFQLEPDSQEQQVRMDWFAADADMSAYRDRATDAGIGPLENNFDLCGA